MLADSSATHSFTSYELLRSLNSPVRNADRLDIMLEKGSIIAYIYAVELFSWFIARNNR